MIAVIKIIEIIVSILLVVLILLQRKNSGLSLTTFSENFGKFERRWPEKFIYNLTAVLAIIFVVNTFVYFLVA